MIRMILQGGLGNQMFEYASALAMANEMHTSLVLDTSIFDVYGDRAWCRPYELGIFALSDGATLESKRHLAVRFLSKLRAYCRKKGRTHFGHYYFDTNVADISYKQSNIDLYGYFTNCHLFAPYREVLLKAFAFKEQPNKANLAILKEIDCCESVSVHIRREDYLNSTNAQMFYTPSVTWYRKAIDEINKEFSDVRLFFFSDDIAWAKKQFSDLTNAVFVDINHGKDAYNDMRLMSRCKHNIIANSSFSWWGAWLNTNPDKVVIAPAKYYMDEESNNKYRSNMIPNEWIISE